MNLWKTFFIVIILIIVFNSKSIPGYEYGEITPEVKIMANNDLIVKTGEYKYTLHKGLGSFNIMISIYNSHDFSVEFQDVTFKYCIQSPGSVHGNTWSEKDWGDVCIPPGIVYSNSVEVNVGSLKKGTSEILLTITSNYFEKDRRRISIESEFTTITITYDSTPERKDQKNTSLLEKLNIDWNDVRDLIFVLAAVATIIGMLKTRKKKKRR